MGYFVWSFFLYFGGKGKGGEILHYKYFWERG